MSVMSGSSAVSSVVADNSTGETMYDLQGRAVDTGTTGTGIYIVKSATETRKIVKR